jgi:hypothetical protein
MVVRANETRQDQLAGTVYGLGLGIAFLHIGCTAYSSDMFTFADDRSIPYYLVLFAELHNDTILKANRHFRSFLLGGLGG